MGAEWRTAASPLVRFTFEQLIARGVLEIGDGYRAKNEELGGEGPIFLRSGHVSDTHIDFTSADRFQEPAPALIETKKSKPGDVVVTTKGWSTGRVCFVTKVMPEFVYSPHLSYWRSLNTDVIRSEFLRYWSLSPECQTQMQAVKMGIDIHPYLSLTTQRTLHISLPPIGIQRSISSILQTIDSKIDLNRHMNETLEAMARALFRSWFVDFDPVHAKADGRAPSGMNEETAKLFPSGFESSELGEIPKGWKGSKLGLEVERNGGAIQTGPFGSQLHASDYVPDGIPVVMPKDISDRRVSTASVARIGEHDAERLSRHRLHSGDIVYSRRGDVERHALISQREVGWLCGTGCLLVRLGPKWPSPVFASFALDRPESRAWLTQHAIGATMPNLNTGILADVPLVMPPDEILRAFALMVDPWQRLIVARDAETASLTRVRDELLPRLLSGEIDVSDAERFVGAAL